MKLKKIDIREIEGFRLGNAEDVDAGTGVTVIISENGAVAGVDVRGGGPATRETDLLRSENTVDKINAVVLSGGSAFGLEAASGVMRALAERGDGFKVGDITVPIVAGASLFDLAVGKSDVFPDVQMGREAVQNAFREVFESGNHGAGTGASVGKMMGMDRAMKTGLGTFACGDECVQVGAIAAVNACADVYNGAGNIIAGLRSVDGKEIQGTVKVLKGMIHPESDPELSLSDIRLMAAEEAGKKTKTSDELPAGTKDDIARALMASYEQEMLQSAEKSETVIQAEPDELPAVTEQYEVPAETPPTPSGDAPAAEDVSEDPVTGTIDEQPEDRYLSYGNEGLPESSSSQSSYSEQEPEEETASSVSEPAFEETDKSTDTVEEATEDDGFNLTEEDKADMGYDIPFNTTISCVITNAIITKSQANKLASILHDAYARAIKPVHTTLDGDTVFVMSTCTQEVNFDAFAALATDVLQYAIIDGAHSAESAYGLPASRDIIRK